MGNLAKRRGNETALTNEGAKLGKTLAVLLGRKDPKNKLAGVLTIQLMEHQTSVRKPDLVLINKKKKLLENHGMKMKECKDINKYMDFAKKWKRFPGLF